MKLDQLRDLFKEWLLEAIAEDEEVRSVVIEAIADNSNSLMEAIAYRSAAKEPTNPDLYDKLLLISQGKEKPFRHEGKIVKVPNRGIGFRSRKKIEEWANKAYEKLGGSWNQASQANQKPPESLSFFQGVFGEQQSGRPHIAPPTSVEEEKQIKEVLAANGNTHMMMEDGSTVDMTSILMDTAKTTFKQQPLTHDSTSGGGSRPADAAAAVVADKTPEELFGSEMTGNWASLAFSNVDKG